MPKRIGLEIGTAKTKLVVGNASKSEFRLSGYEVFDTLDGVYTIDEDIDLLRMELPIKEAMGRLNVKNGELYVTINNEKVIIRTRELPRVGPKEMLDIVRFEAESFLPYDIDAFYIDYKVLDEVDEKEIGETDDKQVFFNVMIIAAPKDVVDQYIELASRLKLKLKIVTVYTEAVTKFFNKHYLEDKKNTLFVDIGNKYTNMTMFEGNHYFANIKTERGINGMYERLVDHHGFNEHDVKYYMYNYTGELGEPIKREEEEHVSLEEDSSLKDLQMKLQSIQKANTNLSESDTDLLSLRNREYDSIINEVNRMVEFFKTRKYGTFVDQIFVFGGGAYLSDFAEIVNESLGVPCEVLPNKGYAGSIDKESYELMIPSIGACIGGKS
ncbi:hypothetical protein EZV73_14500 [Acidaminobacter sp. JC074]|uniref:pilus assembly protein PilM n=1 Tax=Acidaminobacter sp. JC074 TaxID=2530199 RepID=UPI001F0DE8DD|nr:pilus assembly protein PilM [Acidaminobacter sp. JC074]MCH4888802.1 hypothetical protein [Acidaminobacter sp. JC074]